MYVFLFTIVGTAITNMKITRLFATLTAVAGLFALSNAAHAIIVLTPGTSGVIAGYGYGPSNCEPACVESVFSTSVSSLLYKDGPGEAEEGSHASSYFSLFYNTLSDPSDALIGWNFGPAISCDSCYLAIKDGNASPGYYFYDLSGWNGMELISLQNFWPRRGAISHVSIWGGSGSTSVPEPATLGLLGLGMLFAGFAQRRKRA